MSEKEIRIQFSAPLTPLDSECQTYGCRANNPNICANAYMQHVCAFVTCDHVCKKPSKAWKKQYFKLLEGGVKL